MPTFELTTPEGKVYDIEAADLMAAHKAIAHAFGPAPAVARAPAPAPAPPAAPERPMDALSRLAAGIGIGPAVMPQAPAMPQPQAAPQMPQAPMPAQPVAPAPAPAAPPPAPVLDSATQNRLFGLARVIASGRGSMPSIQTAVSRLQPVEQAALSRILTAWSAGGGLNESSRNQPKPAETNPQGGPA